MDSASSFVGPRQVQPEYQKQYTLVKIEGRLRFAAVLRHTLGLPPEILAEIFLHCLPPAYESMLPHFYSAPLVLCRVCRRWRDVATATSALWSKLHIAFDTMPMTHDLELYNLYKTWLSRARGAPLSLLVEQREQSQEEDPLARSAADSLIRIIVGLSRQWRSLEVDLTQQLANVMFPTEGTYPLLEDLDIWSDAAISIFHAPQLREVSISPHIRLPWHQLTTLRCYGASVPSCVDILRQSPNLLEVNFRLQGGPKPITTSIFHLDRLQSLALGSCGDMAHHLMHVLDCLTIPALKTLTLEFPEIAPTNESPYLSFRSFISRSSCQIHTLSLEYLPTMVTSLIACLQATPSLVVLKLLPAPHLADMCAVFGHLTGVNDFLPKLEVFDTCLPDNSTAEWLPIVSVVTRMVCWRWAAATRLRSFRLGHYGDDDLVIDALESHPDCHRLQAEGMELYFGNDDDYDW
ncbi:hypothetical protein DFH06DRAFT_1289499 [Mycena polygramma]|nr:hypothetical protein DFH06DRAFT_1289499 [Mycena polygramma]